MVLFALATQQDEPETLRPLNLDTFPAEIPDYFWDAAYFELPDFRPPRIDPSGNEGIRHLGLDEVLDAVIGDRL